MAESRNHIPAGDPDAAPLAAVEGVVGHGRRLGRELGFPTANLAVGANLGLEDGVYRSRAEVAGRWYNAMSNLGRNPSVGETERRLETHLFGFPGAVYGRRLRAQLPERTRGARGLAPAAHREAPLARRPADTLALIRDNTPPTPDVLCV